MSERECSDLTKITSVMASEIDCRKYEMMKNKKYSDDVELEFLRELHGLRCLAENVIRFGVF